jgi:hypothetical protein
MTPLECTPHQVHREISASVAALEAELRTQSASLQTQRDAAAGTARRAEEAAARAVAAEARLEAAQQALRAVEMDKASISDDLDEAQGVIIGLRETAARQLRSVKAATERADAAERRAAEAMGERRPSQRPSQHSSRVLDAVLVHAWTLACSRALAHWQLALAAVPAAVPSAVPSATQAQRSPLQRAAHSPLHRLLSPPASAAAGAKGGSGSAQLEAELEAYELRLVTSALRRALVLGDEARVSASLGRAYRRWAIAAALVSVQTAHESEMARVVRLHAGVAEVGRVVRGQAQRLSGGKPAPEPAAVLAASTAGEPPIHEAHGAPSRAPTEAHGAPSRPPFHEAQLAAQVQSLEHRLRVSALERALALFKHPAIAQLQQMHALRKWHGVLLYARAFMLAYAKASERARTAPPTRSDRQPAQPVGTQSDSMHTTAALIPRAVAMSAARSAACAFLRLGCGTPGRFQLLQRSIGRWKEALCAFDGREAKKEASAANERARNLKRGWKEERDARQAGEHKASTLEAKVAELEAQIAELTRQLRAAGEGARMAAEAKENAPRQVGAGVLVAVEPPPSQLPPPDQTSSVAGIIGQLKMALAKNLHRIIDTFREFDEDQSGTINKREFGLALQKLGIVAHKSTCDLTFDSLDNDRSGTLEYQELHDHLRRRAGDPSHLDAVLSTVSPGRNLEKASLPAPATSQLPPPSQVTRTSQLPEPPGVLARVRDLEQRLKAAKEELARSEMAIKVDRRALATLREERQPLVDELLTLRKVKTSTDQLQRRIEQLEQSKSALTLERAALRLKVLATGLDAAALPGERSAALASRLAKRRLQATVGTLTASVSGARWRAAGALWRFCSSQRLVRALATWAACVERARLGAELQSRIDELELLVDEATSRGAADGEARLDKLRRAADEKLRKERQLAATRLAERDALARQVVQLQAQIRHAAAVPNRPQDTANAMAPTSSVKFDQTTPRVNSAPRAGANSAPRAGVNSGATPPTTPSRGGAGGPATNRLARGGLGGGGDDEGDGAGGASGRRVRPPIPKPPHPQGLLIEEEVRELRAALAASRTERDVLRMEMEAMALELETTRELLGS